MNPAREALRLFQQAEHAVGEAIATNLMALVHLVSGDPPTALAQAKEASKLAISAGDRKVQADTLDTLYQIHISKGDSARAMAVVKERVAILQNLTDKRALASALNSLSRLQLERGLDEAAAKTADEATILLEELGDIEGGKVAKQTLSKALVQVGREDEAPNRSKALTCLSRLANAAERRDVDAFNHAMSDLTETGGYNDKDIRGYLLPVMEKDHAGVTKFLSLFAPAVADKSVGTAIHIMTKQNFYMGHRLGGLQYGPRFQCVRSARVEGDPNRGIAAMQASSLCEMWELSTGYHAGILDGSLQAGLAAIGDNPHFLKAQEPKVA
jgi:tetratricopeptide (TPR) repeat protein